MIPEGSNALAARNLLRVLPPKQSGHLEVLPLSLTPDLPRHPLALPLVLPLTLQEANADGEVRTPEPASSVRWGAIAVALRPCDILLRRCRQLVDIDE